MDSWWRFILMPTTGASVHIIQKFLFEWPVVESDTNQKFQKPFFFTWLGSVGLFLTFLFAVIPNWHTFLGRFRSTDSWIYPIVLVGISTFFNLIAGSLSNFSSLYLNYSVSLMLRSSTLIFGALIHVFYLKRSLARHEIIGVSMTLFSVIFVGIAAMNSHSATTHRSASSYVIGFYVAVRILSKSLQAISMILEEKVMNMINLAPIELTGVTGVWSLVLSTPILLPMEDLSETVTIISGSRPIAFLSLLSVIVFAVWTVLSLQITKKASAVARMVFDQLTVVIVWVGQLGIRWAVVGTKYEERFGKTGEQWTNWSWLQLFGFGVMVVGACVYQGIISLHSGRSPRTEKDGYERLAKKESLAVV
jgi:drug/metabolite transporter (DMT)-like permease